MRFRSIASSLLALSACAGASDTNDGPDPASGKLLKVTYLRFETDPRTKRTTPQYRVMISYSWREKFGDVANEPLAKLFRHGARRPFLGGVPDEKMEFLLRALRNRGIDKLVSVRPEDLDLVALNQTEKDPELAKRTRIITIGDGTVHRSYQFKDVGISDDLARIFSGCETDVLRMAIQYTAQVTTETSPVVPKD